LRVLHFERRQFVGAVRRDYSGDSPSIGTVYQSFAMFDRFTDNSKKAMNSARREAQRMGHDYFGPEHILLALAGMPDCTAARVISAQGITAEQIRSEVEKRVKATTAVTMGQMPFTPQAKRVLELAMEEASNFGHSYIGTEHLLLGVIGGEDDVAAGALKQLGCEAESLRVEVSVLLTPEQHDREGRALELRKLTYAAEILQRHGETELAEAVLRAFERLSKKQ
jgi:ATP-dependent Clp protease ATP-binding subunit ClpA